MRRPVVLALLVSPVLAGCGGSSSTSTSTTTSTSAGANGSANSGATGSANSGATGSASSSAAATSSVPSTSSASAPVTSASTTTTTTTAASTSSTTVAPDTNVRLPAKFVIRPGDTLVPPVVAAPKHTTIDLTVRSQDGKRHTVVLATPHGNTLVVVPGQPARLTLKGLPNGAYVVKVDGAVRGRLIVGANPGP